MNLYKIEHHNTNDPPYEDTYDSAVVCADSEENARLIHPNGDQAGLKWYIEKDGWKWRDWARSKAIRTWALPKDIGVTFIGVADKTIKPGVICASFKSG